ncbi:DUF3526 domain-containing protein [Flammeovirgaceae bacterium SG7u.111]|nr:DUF3526 domain-containing protein [Flammeovirgaceae bacterium SG7u.132]WPO38348.1 DUF3526 domain-containing protein [Flammeovirgaceae bacterium SG7u.111]
MYRLLFRQFVRTKTCQIGLALVLLLGGISIITGKQFLINQAKIADQVVEKQLTHIERNIDLHGDDLPLLLYYLKFTLVHATHPLSGFSIGQRDLNPSVQSVTILTLEGQKYDTDLVNPTKLLYGNLDLSFIIVYVFPLLIIAFTYNLFSEEEESGTWKLVNVMAKSTLAFLVAKLSVRFVLLALVMILLLVVGALVLGISFDGALLLFVMTSLLYLTFWFALCFWLICLKRNSNFNALALLSIWLVLVVLLPAFINSYITTKHPVPEALSTMIKQRDGTHKKWDSNKKETLEAFYKDYPQFASFGFPPEKGFDWGWYYAMQHLGDVESREDSQAMQQKIRLREEMSKQWAQVIPSMHTQLALNNIAGTGLLDHMDFLSHTNEFHEQTRLYFYPKIFSDKDPESVEWDRFKPEYFQVNGKMEWIATLFPLVLSIVFFMGLSFVQIRKK